MAIALVGHAQVKSISKNSVPMVPMTAQKAVTGLENIKATSPASVQTGNREEEPIDIGQTYYDWQSNMASRNFTAVWPDGFAAMAWTTSTQTDFSDRGTGIATFDPTTGKWSYCEGRVEPVKTDFGSISRYKQNGLVVAAHTSTDVIIYINEDFRNGGTTWTEVALPNDSHHPCWPVVQCSGTDNDIIHLLYTDKGATSPYPDPLLYSRYQDGQWAVEHQILPYMDENYISDGNANIAYFMPYDPAKPYRVALRQQRRTSCRL